MPTQEYSSAGKTFSMSRWAMMLPIVARRSPAITTPPAKVGGDDRRAVRRVQTGRGAESGSGRPPGSSSGAWPRRKSANDGDPALQERRRQAVRRPAVLSGTGYSPPFWTNAADELLGVGLEDLVDLVEHRVDVLVERGLARGRRVGPGSSSGGASSGSSVRRVVRS